MPREGEERLLDLPATATLENVAKLSGPANYADVRLAWNEFGLGFQVTVSGKRKPPVGDVARPWASDGVTLWIDTRDSRTNHRASRFCHQFHLLPAGEGPEQDEPAFVQTVIPRASQDAPLSTVSEVLLRCHSKKGSYQLELFLPAAVLTGYDPEQHPRMGVYYHVRDAELGDQFLAVNAEFPFAEDPTLWEPLDLIGAGTTAEG
jgi:hypothetical protein